MSDLRELVIWGAILVLPGSPFAPPPFQLPRLSHLSLCGVHIPDKFLPFFNPSTLPALSSIAYVFYTSSLSLSAFPPTLRVLCNAPLRRRSPASAHTTLYWTRFSPTPDPALLGFVAGAGDDPAAAWETQVRHLRLTDIYVRDADAGLVAWVRALPHLETLYVPKARLGPEDGPLRTLCRERGIALKGEKEEDAEEAHFWGSVMPREWR